MSMKTTSWLIGASLLAVTLSLGQPRIAAQRAKPEPKVGGLKPVEIRNIQAEAAAPKPVSLKLVSQEFTGSFDSVEESFTTFKGEITKQQVGAAGKPQTYLILQEDPTGKGSFKYSIGIVTAGKAKIEAPLKNETLNFDKAVSHTHVGPYTDLEAVHGAIRTAAKSTKFPVALHLINNPKFPVVMPGKGPKAAAGPNIRTELLVPIE